MNSKKIPVDTPFYNPRTHKIKFAFELAKLVNMKNYLIPKWSHLFVEVTDTKRLPRAARRLLERRTFKLKYGKLKF